MIPLDLLDGQEESERTSWAVFVWPSVCWALIGAVFAAILWRMG